MAPLAERKFQGDASDDQAATAPRAVSAARHRENTARQYAANDQAGDLLDQGRPSQRLQIPCAAIGALFATADAAAITLASLLGAGGYQQFISHVPWNLNFHVGAGLTAALLYGLIGRSSGFYLISDIFSIRRNTSSIVWQLFFTALLLALLAFRLPMPALLSRAIGVPRVD